MDTAEQKKKSRRETRERLAKLTGAERATASREIARAIRALPAWRAARAVLLFAPTATEPDIGELFEAAIADGKEVFYPRVEGEELAVCRVRRREELRAGSFGILEPVTEGEAAAGIELAVVPGLAFDAGNRRLGKGKGYYDRFLAATRVPAIGVCFACQIVPEVPADEYDARVGLVVTEC